MNNICAGNPSMGLFLALPGFNNARSSRAFLRWMGVPHPDI
jgi:hypothetical protein